MEPLYGDLTGIQLRDGFLLSLNLPTERTKALIT